MRLQSLALQKHYHGSVVHNRVAQQSPLTTSNLVQVPAHLCNFPRSEARLAELAIVQDGVG